MARGPQKHMEKQKHFIFFDNKTEMRLEKAPVYLTFSLFHCFKIGLADVANINRLFMAVYFKHAH